MSNTDKERISWQGTITSVQCRAWVWRYKTDNRTHHHLGYNLWLTDEAGGKKKFIVAISEKQYQKYQFMIGDEVKGTGWTCKKSKHEVADLNRAGGFKILSRSEKPIYPNHTPPPYLGSLPSLEVFEFRGARMLDQKVWRKRCMTCMWANQSAIEIEYDFGKTKRYRKETFCYGPKSCPFYEMGPPRPVQYVDDWGGVSTMDTGFLDDIMSERRGYDD